MRPTLRACLLVLTAGCGEAAPQIIAQLNIERSLEAEQIVRLEVFVVGEQRLSGELLSCETFATVSLTALIDVQHLAHALTSPGGSVRLDEVDATRRVVIVVNAFDNADAVGEPTARACRDRVVLRRGEVNRLTLTLEELPR